MTEVHCVSARIILKSLLDVLDGISEEKVGNRILHRS